jgi:hydroxymethylglutaryl-CoA reductase (NADPH)
MKHAKTLSDRIIESNWEILKNHTALDGADQRKIADPDTLADIESYSHNIENCIGTLKLPIGVAGPLRINGFFANHDYYIPLATTEAALVASYNRGARLITEAGGCSVLLLNDAVTRAPGFVFRTLAEVVEFVAWLSGQAEALQAVAEETTRHGKLIDARATVEGNHVYINFDYSAGDAAGQNMATIATAAVCEYIVGHSPVKPVHSFVEANLSGDKKASALSFLSVRGKKVTAEIVLPAALVQRYLHTTPATLVEYWRLSALGGVLSGTMGVQGHYANGLAALYLATGQDVACVSESSVGVTRMELTQQGDLYTSVTLSNIIVGSVGGGTKLPSQQVGLKMLGLAGAGKVQALAEVCAAVCLAGELSIMGAMCAGDFASAHRKLARG